jgi:hypothetical protein
MGEPYELIRLQGAASRFTPIRLQILLPKILGAIAISASLRASGRIVDLAILASSPASHASKAQLMSLSSGAALNYCVAISAFGLAGVVSMLVLRPYIKASAVGIFLSFVAFGLWQAGSLCLVIFFTNKVHALAVSVICGVIGFKTIEKGAEMFVGARRYMLPTFEEVERVDQRLPILYLRPFVMDDVRATGQYSLEARKGRVLTWRVLNSSFWTEAREWTLEEVLCKGIGIAGPVVAMGRPGEALPRLGAVRKYCETQDWQSEVLEFFRRCSFACLMIGDSETLVWEFGRIVEHGDESRVILIIPPGADRGRLWQKFTSRVEALGLKSLIPAEIPEGALAVLFGEGWKPIVISGEPTLAGYQEIAKMIRPQTIRSASPLNQ